ncbi:MAG: AAA family ATPase, partial [Myxococcota bacterium]|nr:AAA family ATPase [Myxococcota bacterium]
MREPGNSRNITWTPSQTAALERFDEFLGGRELRGAFVLRGAAGTGKSTLARELVRVARGRGLHTVLMAPTGRAARVFGERTKCEAKTIHGVIYDFDKVTEIKGESEQPVFQFELGASDEFANTVFFVDEASMVGDVFSENTNLRFGTGRLLRDLLHYVFWAHPDARRKIVLIGDHCQLLPVTDSASPALDRGYLERQHELRVGEATLKEAIRQSDGSRILEMAEQLRRAIEAAQFHRLEWGDGPDLVLFDAEPEFSARLRTSHEQGEAPHVVCYKNRTVRDWNQWVREDVLSREGALAVGDRIVVQRNHHQSALMNGDFAEVISVGPAEDERFRGTELRYIHVEVEYETELGRCNWQGLLLENLLLSPERELSEEENQARWVCFKMRHAGLKPGTHEFKLAIMEDPRWNSLMAKQGYATTCHKAQGGEWDEVFLHCDFGTNQGLKNAEKFRWLYTAVTRAKKRLYVLSAPSWSPLDALRTPGPSPGSSAGGGSQAPPQDTATTPAPESVEDQIEAVVGIAAAARGLSVDQTRRLSYMIRADLRGPVGAYRCDVRYSGKGEVGGIAWSRLPDGSGPPFDVPELEARMILRRPDALPVGLPIGIHEAVEQLQEAARKTNLEARWEAQPFAIRMFFVDPTDLA